MKSHLLNVKNKSSAVRTLRQHADRYDQSNEITTKQQAEILNKVADCILQDDFEKACLYFEALHKNIKQGLEFHVLEYLDKAEIYVSDDKS